MNEARVALLFLLLPVTVLVTVEGLYVVQVRVNHYDNPTNKCGTCIASDGSYGCCDSWISGTCTGSLRCDNAFRYCLRPLGTLVNDFHCLNIYPQVTSHTSYDDEEIDFSQSEVLQLSNPFTLNGLTFSWMGVQLFVVVIDQDSESADDPVDSLAIDLNVHNTVLGVESERIVYDGIFNLSHIGLQYEVRCAENYNGDYCENLDECLLHSAICGVNEYCQDGHNSFACVCNPGYTGPNCDIDIDDCADVDCSENGRCVDSGIGSYSCECFAGFTGSLCEVNIDDCIGVDCNGNGQCQDRVNSFTCACSPGFTGELCEIELTVSNCVGIDCSDNGYCMDEVNSFSCICDSGFTGELCEINIDDCVGMDCNGNGRCEDGVDSFTCVCDPDFTGQQCEIDNSVAGIGSDVDEAMDICTNVNCQNNGLCMNRTDTFLCICDSGFTGQLCETNIDDCAIMDCSGNGQCVDGVNEYGCICFSGYYGDHCENHPNMNSNAQDRQGGHPGMIIIFGTIAGTVLLVSTFAITIGVIVCVYVRAKTKHSKQDTPQKGIDCDENRVSVELNRNVGYGVLGVYGDGQQPDPTRVGSRRDPIYVENDQVLNCYNDVL